MRRFLIELILIAAALFILWLVAGRQIAGLVDRFTTAKIESIEIKVIAYQGGDEGGELSIGPRHFGLAPLNPHVGSTKENQLGLAYGGKVFALGPLSPSESEAMLTQVPQSDRDSLIARHSYLPWVEFQSSTKPQLHRAKYYEFVSNKSDGAKLRLIWSVSADEQSTSLIRIEITGAAR
jgi:hypothetical protein